jgi:GNAT superfamily N-acetyltransferase
MLRAMSAADPAPTPQAPRPARTALRAVTAADLEWVVARHGALYAQEFGWDASFEALVGRIVAGFAQRFDPAREAGWIAERDGQPLGCVFLVQARGDDGAAQPGVAQLRLLLVEPQARGLGLGRQLVDECTRFARTAGYRHLRLWTNSVLVAARALYTATGYVQVASAPHRSFGRDLVGETWERPL